jgi:hypothetical protein
MRTEHRHRTSPSAPVPPDRPIFAIIGLRCVGFPQTRACPEAGPCEVGGGSRANRVRVLHTSAIAQPPKALLWSGLSSRTIGEAEDDLGLGRAAALFTYAPRPPQNVPARYDPVHSCAAASAHRGRATPTVTRRSTVRPSLESASSSAGGLHRAVAALVPVPKPEAARPARSAFGLTLLNDPGTRPGAVGV